MPQEFIYVPVPANRVDEVYRLLGTKALAEKAEPPARDLALITRVWAESHANHRALMTFLAEHPDRWFTTRELAKPLGLSNARQVAGMLGAFGRRAKHR